MKVQHRSKDIIGIEWEAVDEAKAYYIVKDPAGFLQVLDKKDYEPVEEWVDVTHECNMLLIGETYRVYHAGAWIGDPDKYRVSNATSLSKVKVEVKR